MVYRYQKLIGETKIVDTLQEYMTQLTYEDKEGNQHSFFNDKTAIFGLAQEKDNEIVYRKELNNQEVTILPPSSRRKTANLFFYFHGSQIKEHKHIYDLSLFLWYDVSKYKAYGLTAQIRKQIIELLELQNRTSVYQNCNFSEMHKAMDVFRYKKELIELSPNYFETPYILLEARFNVFDTE